MKWTVKSFSSTVSSSSSEGKKRDFVGQRLDNFSKNKYRIVNLPQALLWLEQIWYVRPLLERGLESVELSAIQDYYTPPAG